MEGLCCSSETQLEDIRKAVAEMGGRSKEEVRVVVSPYRICPLGAHIDHQGGTVLAMTIDKGILLGFLPSTDSQVLLRSGQFEGEVTFRVDEIQHPVHSVEANGNNHLQEECGWGRYARGAVYALQRRGNKLSRGIIGFICGSEGLHSSGLSSSAAVGVAYLLALEAANNLSVSPTDNIEYDRLIENEYLGLKNGILDQSAILLSSYGCLTFMDCKIKQHRLVHPPELHESQKAYKILLAFSGLKQALTTNPGYNNRVAECREAARVLLKASGKGDLEPILSNVEPQAYEVHKHALEPSLARRAEHYFSESLRVLKGLEAWGSNNLEGFGKLMSASGVSSIEKYECGCEALIQLYEIVTSAPGVYGARFSGAGFRGCCVAIVDANLTAQAAAYVTARYHKLQPQLAANQQPLVLICNSGDCARII